jgi:hypothetical protein
MIKLLKQKLERWHFVSNKAFVVKRMKTMAESDYSVHPIQRGHKTWRNKL